jgi:hypothetical protein
MTVGIGVLVSGEKSGRVENFPNGLEPTVELKIRRLGPLQRPFPERISQHGSAERPPKGHLARWSLSWPITSELPVRGSN